MEYKDYYKILGVDKNASKEEIKRQYRKLARKYHPDINPNDKQSERKFAEINEAHEVLTDDAKRKKYDTLGSNWQQYQDPRQSGGFDWSRYARSGNGTTYTYFEGDWDDLFGGAGFSDFFKSFFGDDVVRQKRKKQRHTFRGQDLAAEMEISLQEAYSGCTKIINVNGRNLRIRLEPGIKNGQKIRLKGKGAPGANGGENGDLYITIKIPFHPDYKRDGDDLFTEVPVDMYTALLGGSLNVKTISGTFKLSIPSGTQNGTTFRLKGRGFPVFGKKNSCGDLFIKIDLKIPKNLSPEEREMLKKMAARKNTS